MASMSDLASQVDAALADRSGDPSTGVWCGNCGEALELTTVTPFATVTARVALVSEVDGWVVLHWPGGGYHRCRLVED